MLIPSSQDDSLAPKGHHVMSLLCKYFPYQLSAGRSWDAIKEQVADQVLARVARHIPNLPDITVARQVLRSEEHTSELQSLMRISYAVFCLKKKTQHHVHHKP